MASRYPEGMIEWIRQQYLRMDIQELTKECNNRFGTSLGVKSMSSLKKRYGFRGGPRAKIYSKQFPKEVCDYIKENYVGVGRKEMCSRLMKEFGREYTESQIKSFYANHDLNSGITGHFVKGQKSPTKGKKMPHEVYEKVKDTMFKKGNRPHNAVPVGSTTITEDGYSKTKIAEPDEWEFTHRLIWRQHFGEVPSGMLVGFKDGDRSNLTPENLMLLSNREHLEMIRRGLRSEFAELTEVGLTIAKLNIAARDRKRRR